MENKIKNLLQEAIKERKSPTEINLLKLIVSEFSRRKNPHEHIPDKDVIAILRKLKDASEEMVKYKPTDEDSKFAVMYLTELLPKEVNEQDIIDFITSNLTLPEDPNKRMILMKDILKQFPNENGNRIKTILQNL